MKKLFFMFVALLLLAGCTKSQPFVPDDILPTAPVVADPAKPYADSVPIAVASPPDSGEVMPSVSRGEYASHQSPDLQKAFADGMKLCNYRMKDAMLGDVLIKVWILSSDRFRLEKAVPGTRISTIYDQLIVHSWDDRTKQGVVLSLKDLDNIPEERVAGIEIPKSPAEATTGANSVVCVTSTAIGEDILDVPDNVGFVSLGSLAEK